MASKTVVTCDVCGAQKREVNHWWDVRAGGQTEITGDVPYLFVVPIGQECGARSDVVLNCCGQQCVTVLVQRWMAEGKLWPVTPDKKIGPITLISADLPD